MAELKALSKLKMAGKLHYWRGTIEIDENELRAICDEIQAEHDKTVAAISKDADNWEKVVAAMNEAAGNWAKTDAFIRDMEMDVYAQPQQLRGEGDGDET